MVGYLFVASCFLSSSYNFGNDIADLFIEPKTKNHAVSLGPGVK